MIVRFTDTTQRLYLGANFAHKNRTSRTLCKPTP